MKSEKGRIIFESEEELLPVAMSLNSTRWNQTGSWKFLEPYHQNLTPPCVAGCRAGNDIVTFMRLIDEGRYHEAAKNLLDHNPFPSTLGRVCPHPCESVCNRKEMGGEIAIQSAERFLGDYAIQHGLLPRGAGGNGKRVTVVGAGPGGLSAAYFLRNLGYQVSVVEADSRAGGLLWSGIPPYRLPRNILQGELDRLEYLDIEFHFNKKLGVDVTLESLRQESAAVVLAIGLGRSRNLGIPGEDHPQVLDGIRLLKGIHRSEIPPVGDKIAVIGGGNTALDCARSLVRIGRTVTVFYRRSRAEMPAFVEELQEAIDEGVSFEFLASPTRLLLSGDQVKGLEFIRMKLVEKDESGRSSPVPIPDSEFFAEVDTVVKALGETLDPKVLNGLEASDAAVSAHNYQTTLAEVFACGDCLGKGGTVADAVRSGRETAYAVDSFLKRTLFNAPDPLKQRKASTEIAQFSAFNTDYFDVRNGPPRSIRSAVERMQDFSEVREGLSETSIRMEAARCFKCGTCTQCDNCRIFCPDGAIVSKNGSYEVLAQYCKGCMVCVEECPRGAIHLRRMEV